LGYVKPSRFAAISAALLLAYVSALAQDTPATRQVAADRYLKAVPMAKLLDDTFQEMSKQRPPEQRAQFIADMKKVVRADFLEKTCRQAMVKIFTTDELNALADFYGSKNGSSAMRKFGAYMAEVMPAIQTEVQRGVQEQQKSQPRQ